MAFLSHRPVRLLAAATLMLAATLPGSAQSRATVTVEDYARAEKFMGYNTNPLVSNGPVRANWLPGDRFWYRNTDANGSQFILVDAAKATKVPAFDHAAIAATLSTTMGRTIAPGRLPFNQITFSADSAS